MEINDCFLVGYVAKLLGYKGEVVLYIDADEPDKYLEMESVYVSKANKLIPFFFDKLQAHSRQNHFIAKFQDIDSVEQASMFVGCELYLSLDYLPDLSGKQFYFHEVVGFTLVDKQKGLIGEIKEIIDVSSSPIFQIFTGNKEVLLPIHDDFIISIDRKSKTINYKAPEGLIDMYLDDNLYSENE